MERHEDHPDLAGEGQIRLPLAGGVGGVMGAFEAGREIGGYVAVVYSLYCDGQTKAWMRSSTTAPVEGLITGRPKLF